MIYVGFLLNELDRLYDDICYELDYDELAALPTSKELSIDWEVVEKVMDYEEDRATRLITHILFCEEEAVPVPEGWQKEYNEILHNWDIDRRRAFFENLFP